jgi:hypothetical protein
MSRYAVWISAPCAAALLAGAASAQSFNPQPDPPGRHEVRQEHAIVRLPPGPCAQFGGRVEGGGLCTVPYVFIEPPDPCLREHGRVVQTREGRSACLLRR